MITPRWFFSSTLRHAGDLRKHVQKLLDAQRDLLGPQAIAGVETALKATDDAIKSGANDAALRAQMESLEEAANKWIKPYPNADWRDNVEVCLVAIVVAMGIRTFFLQPFKIPTGSMQPTLYGVVTEDLRGDRNFKMPGFLEQQFEKIVHGTIYHEIIAPEDGEIVGLGHMQSELHALNKQDLTVRYSSGRQQTFTIWGGPDDPANMIKAGLLLPYPPYSVAASPFKKGQPIIRFKETTGDHLFVDRMTYNFRHPRRGDIIVFKTQGISGIRDQDQFYIKRLIGLPDETVSIGEDRHIRINGQRLDASTPHLANVYGFDPNGQPRESVWSGHTLAGNYLSSPQDSFKIDPGHFMAFGDNTVNSADSRYWGELPEDNVIGKSFFVYWPIGPRFGWGQE